jgi:hypothetical protein
VHGLADLPANSGMILRMNAREERLEMALYARTNGASLWSRLRSRLARMQIAQRTAAAGASFADARRLSFLLRVEDATVDLDYLQLRDAEWELRLQAMDERRVHVTLQTLAPDARLWFAGAIERSR